MVLFRQKIRGTIKQLGLRIGRFLEESTQEEDSFKDEQAEMDSPKKKSTSCLCKPQCTSFSLAGGLSSSACAAVRKKKSQQHSRAHPRDRFIFNAPNICRLSCGWPEVVHCRTYSTAVHVIEEGQIVLNQHVQTGFRGQSRDEGVRAKLCGHRVYLTGSHPVSACHQPVGP